ncbi:MAG TPA: aminotransferase class V-fold PLP-dependent enzyme [Baekduia sp.]|nr:aminotransferase class V-fold PLP-dependent enzyme [Baekduia sp.]
MDAARLRAAFPVLKRVVYLNAGTCGPLPGAAQRAAVEAWRSGTEEGRGHAFYGRLIPLAEQLRERYAGVLGASPAEVALTAGTSDGCGHVVAGLQLGPGDEVVTADDEHPGLQGPLIAARDQRGVTVNAVPLADIPGAVTDATRLIACSHVSWHSGAVAPVAEIVAVARPRGIPVLLDGAQGVGAVPTDVARLGVDFYAGSGQKWLCGPVGCGMLWIAPRWLERLAAPRVGYGGLVAPDAGLASPLVTDAHRHDTPLHDLSIVAAAVAAFDVLAEAGMEAVQRRAATLAAHLADALADAGHDVVPRDETTLVAWAVPGGDEEAVAIRDRLQEQGITIRDLPGAGRLRASVGAWNDEDDLERLVMALS